MTQPSASASTSQPRLKTRFKRDRAFEPIYTGGAATALTPDGKYLFAPVNETIHITQVTSGKTANKIPSDLEEVSCLALTSDGKVLLIASRSLAIRVFHIDYHTQQQQQQQQEDGGEEEEGSEEQVTWRLIRNIAKTHDAPIVVMRVDPTDTLLATGSSDGSAKVWDIRGGFCTHVFRNHGGIVSALEWNMPASRIAVEKKGASEKAADRVIELFTGSVDGKVRLWNLKEANERGPQRPSAVLESHFSVVRGLAVNRDGTRLVSAGRDRLLTFWERQKSSKSKGSGAGSSGWKMADSLTAGESMESAGFLADSSDVFWTAGAEGEIRLWSFESRTISHVQPMGRFAKGHATKRKTVTNGEDEEEDEGDETRGITEVHSLPLLNALVSVHADQNIVFRRVPTLQRIRRLVGFNDQIIDMALLSSASTPDSHLAVATNTNSISVYTLGSQEHSVELLPGEEDSEQGHTGLVLCMDKTTDGKWLASGAKDRTVRIWARVPRPASVLPLDDSIGEKVPISSGGKGQGDVEMQWRCVAVGEGHTESVGAVAFARRPAAPDADGAPFLISGSQDRTAKVWDLSKLAAHIEENNSSTLRLTSLTTLKIHDKDINALDVSPNNALLLTGSQDKTAKVFSINYVAPSKANSQVATASLKLVTTCRGHKRGVWSVAFSPNDAVFLTGSGDRSMKLWSITSGFTCIKNYIGHTNSILKVRFLKGSKGLQCLSCASDGLVKVWNVKTEECMDTLDGHEDRVWGLECSRDGDTIISGAADSFICFWKDWTVQQDEAQVKQRQEEVEREQQFNNLLAVKDYRNAISLALAMNQPRRLFNLFTTVDNSRSQGDSTTSTGDLLNSALQMNGKTEGNIDPSLQALVQAGVLSMASAGMMAKTATTTPTPATISGSSLVDQVLETLHPSQLRTLLGFIRDWNTSARTSHIAQLVLHAILRFHSADDIVAAFESDDNDRRDEGQREEEERARTEMRDQHRNQRNIKRQGPQAATDLRTVIESILPYTKRHYDRAQRLLTESAMLQYTLACMDSVLGAEGQDDDEVDDVITKDLAKGQVNGDILMNGVEDSDGEHQSSDEEAASEEAEL